MQIPRFVQKIEPNIQAKMKERSYPLKTTRQLKNETMEKKKLTRNKNKNYS